MLLKRSIKLTAPLVVPAALLTFCPAGRSVLMSIPTPHLRLKSCVSCLKPILKQVDKKAEIVIKKLSTKHARQREEYDKMVLETHYRGQRIS